MRGHTVVQKTQQTQMGGNRKMRVEERNTGASWFSRDGTVLATTPPDTAKSPPSGEADDQPRPFYHATPSAEPLTASARKLSFNPAPDQDNDEESDWSTDTSSDHEDLTLSIH